MLTLCSGLGSRGHRRHPVPGVDWIVWHRQKWAEASTSEFVHSAGNYTRESLTTPYYSYSRRANYTLLRRLFAMLCVRPTTNYKPKDLGENMGNCS